jgi:hypothetical protein
MMMKSALEGAAAVFAFGAAWFWLLSARVKVPDIGPVSGFWNQIGYITPLTEAVKRGAILNRRAAACAMVSALLRGLLSFFPPSRSGCEAIPSCWPPTSSRLWNPAAALSRETPQNRII